jgi:cyclic pyranopterin phosphate synthase
LKDQPTKIADSIYWLGDTLYLNLTNRCTNDCYFCIRKYRKGISKFNLTLEKEPKLEEIIAELERTKSKFWSEYVFCGFGEPTIRLNTVLKIAEWLSRNKTAPIRINTNGHAQLLYPDRKVIDEIKEAGVDRLSISLNAQNMNVYNEVCRPTFENAYKKVLEFIGNARDLDLQVEITAVVIPGKLFYFFTFNYLLSESSHPRKVSFLYIEF